MGLLWLFTEIQQKLFNKNKWNMNSNWLNYAKYTKTIMVLIPDDNNTIETQNIAKMDLPILEVKHSM